MRFQEFRSLVATRIYYNSSKRQIYRKILQKLFCFFYPGQDALFIDASQIGKRMFIQHGFSTIISAESIGEECWINQQVTIGRE